MRGPLALCVCALDPWICCGSIRIQIRGPIFWAILQLCCGSQMNPFWWDGSFDYTQHMICLRDIEKKIWKFWVYMNFDPWNVFWCKSKQFFWQISPNIFLTIKAPITTAADNKFSDIFPNLRKKNKVYFMRIVCQQTILMKYLALFVIFEKASKFEFVICCNM